MDARAAGASRAVLALIVGVCSLLLGCGSEPLAPPDQPLQASASRTRDDDNVGGQFQTRLKNTGSDDVSIASVALDSPGFDPAPANPRSIVLGSGSQIDIPTEFGRVRCDRSPTPAHATVVLGDGVSISVPLATPYDVLDTIAKQECTAEDVTRSVELTLTPLPDSGAATLPAELTVRRSATSESVRVDEVRGSVLYGLTAPLPMTLAPDADSIIVPVDIAAATCAAHAIADSKKPFVFPVFLAFGANDPVYARIPMPQSAQQHLIAFQTRVCAGRP